MVRNLFAILLIVICTGYLSGFSPIYTQETINIGGIEQWITIKGIDSKNPVLLFLHGGPGNSAMGYADKFTSELQKNFVVVQWDQRESGKTAKLNASPEPLTVSLMESDAIEVINYLRSRFSCDKIYLMGHSWGGFLGLKLTADHPELFKAYFAVNPMVYQNESERLSLEWMKVRSEDSKNALALKELEQITVPFSNWEDLYYHRKWLAFWMRTKPAARSFVENWAKKQFRLFQEASEINFFVQAPALQCPVYFFVGSRDYQTYSQLTDDYYKMLKAEKKGLFWFTNSAHNLNLTEPGKLQETILSILNSKN